MTRHTGQVIPVEKKREYAYQSETCYPGASIQSYPSERNNNPEAKRYSEYQLVIHKHTDTHMTVELRKKRRDLREQRMVKGAAVTEEIYQIVIDFAELCNRIFCNGCEVYLEEESFPDEIKEAMKKVYRPSTTE